MVSRSLSDIAFTGAKQLLVSWREQLGIQDTEFELLRSCCAPSKLQNEIKKKVVVLKRKKTFLFEKIDKNVKFNSLLLRNF